MSFRTARPTGCGWSKPRWRGRGLCQHVAVSFLRLPGRLCDLKPYGHVFATASIMGAAHRSGAQTIETEGNAHVLAGGAHVVGRIEADPAEVGDVNFGPGVAHLVARQLACHSACHLARLLSRLLGESAVALAEIAGDIARRRPESARHGDEDVGEVLGYAASCPESVGRRGSGRCGFGIEGNVLV